MVISIFGVEAMGGCIPCVFDRWLVGVDRVGDVWCKWVVVVTFTFAVLGCSVGCNSSYSLSSVLAMCTIFRYYLMELLNTMFGKS